MKSVRAKYQGDKGRKSIPIKDRFLVFYNDGQERKITFKTQKEAQEFVKIVNGIKSFTEKGIGNIFAKGGNVTIPPHANHKEQDEFLKRMNTDENEFGIQGYNDKLDESLGNTKGKRSTKEQNYKDRRNESEAMKKKGGKRKYSSVKTMDKGSRSKRKTPLTLAKEIRKEGEKWQDAVKRASAILKKEAK